MCFDKNKAYNIFQNGFHDYEKRHREDINKIDVDFAERNMIPSGAYVNAHIEAYESHLRVKIDAVISAFLESFPVNFLIKKKTQVKLIDELNKVIDREYESKMDLLKTAIARASLDKTGNSSIYLSSFQTKYAEMRNIKVVLLNSMIEKHNQTAYLEKKKNGFWNKHGKEIIIGLIITIVSGIVLYFLTNALSPPK